MFSVPEDGQYDRNVEHVVTGIIKCVVADGIHLPICNVVYHSGINFTKFVKFSAYSNSIDHITPSVITYSFLLSVRTVNENPEDAHQDCRIGRTKC